jgi:hypothetical protein
MMFKKTGRVAKRSFERPAARPASLSAAGFIFVLLF